MSKNVEMRKDMKDLIKKNRSYIKFVKILNEQRNILKIWNIIKL